MAWNLSLNAGWAKDDVMERVAFRGVVGPRPPLGLEGLVLKFLRRVKLILIRRVYSDAL